MEDSKSQFYHQSSKFYSKKFENNPSSKTDSNDESLIKHHKNYLKDSLNYTILLNNLEEKKNSLIFQSLLNFVNLKLEFYQNETALLLKLKESFNTSYISNYILVIKNKQQN